MLISRFGSLRTLILLYNLIRTVGDLTVPDVLVILTHCLRVESLKICLTALSKQVFLSLRNQSTVIHPQKYKHLVAKFKVV